MAERDGTIVIDTQIDTKGVDAGSEKTEASLRRMAQKVNDIGATAKAALNKQIDAFARLNSQYDSQSEKIDALKRKIAGYSDEYGEMQAKIDETVKKLNDLEMMQGVIKDAVKDSAKRGTTFDTTQYKWVQEDIEKLTKEIEVAEREQDKLFATGNPFELGSKARAAKEDLEKLSQEEGKLADMHNKLQTAYDGVNDKINEYSQKADEATASTSRLSRIGGMVGKAIGGIATFGKNAAKSLTGAKKSSSGFGLSLGTLVKYGFGIRSLYVLVNKLRSALVDGFKNLSQYSGETNGSISMLWSSLERLKNSLATAFAPILTVVAPILSKFIDMLSTAASYVSMFFSFLSGKSTYTRAIAVQKNYAASLGDTASAAKDAADATEDAAKAAEDYLSPLDDINKFTAEDTSSKSPSGGSGGSGGGVGASEPMFEDVAITDIPILEKLKDILSQIFKPFKQAWQQEGKATIDAAKLAFTNLKSLAGDVGKSMLEVWTNGTGTQLLSTALQIVQAILTTIGRIAGKLDEAWNKNSVGTAIIQAIADILQKILDFVNRIAWATADWAAKLDFYPLLDSIRQLLESVSPLVEKIGNFLGNVYEKIILPFLTWLIETGLPTVIEWLGKFFDFLSEHQWIIDLLGATLLGAFAASKIVALITSIMGAIELLMSIIGTKGLIGLLGGPLAVAIAATIAILVLLVTHWDTVKNTMNAIKDWIANAFVHDWTKEFGYLGGYLNAWFKNIKNLWDGIKQIFNGIITFVKGVFTGNWRQAWEGVRQIFAGVWNSFAAIVKAPINTIIAFINSFLYAIQTMQNSFANALNSMSISLPHWLEKLTGFSSVGFNVGYWSAPMVPYLAQGAVIPPNREFMAVLGDQKSGNNIEAPESLIRRIVREESGNGKGSTYNVTAQVNRRTLFDLVLEEGKVRRTVTGRNPFETV